MMKAIQKSSENTNTKTKTMTKTTTKTKTQKKCLKHPTYAIFLKSWWLTHSKYDDRYLTLVILFTPVTLVTLFQSYIQFYRAECITVSGFFHQHLDRHQSLTQSACEMIILTLWLSSKSTETEKQEQIFVTLKISTYIVLERMTCIVLKKTTVL